jgi:hypothetical protein
MSFAGAALSQLGNRQVSVPNTTLIQSSLNPTVDAYGNVTYGSASLPTATDYGLGAIAQARGSCAFGVYAIAIDNGCIAIGPYSNSQVANGVAVGNQCQALAAQVVAIGARANIMTPNSVGIILW